MAANTGSRWNPFWQPAPSSVPAEVDQLPSPGSTTKSKTWKTNVTRVSSWPEEARPLKKHTWMVYLYIFADIILVLLPVYFILLGIAVVTLHGTPSQGSSFGSKVETAMDLGPTIFPIMFAAISGRSMKMVARFLAERGAKLSTLELLMASQSVWGTFESQMLMQRLTLVGVNLLFLWALSPLGGQASLRLMKRDYTETFTSTKLRYLTTGPGGTMWGLTSTYSASGKFADAGALYTAALMAPQANKVGPTDPWGNVKIPNLESLGHLSSDVDGWIDVPTSLPAPESYSSLVGLPIVGLPTNGNSTFTIEYNHITVNCRPFKQVPWPEGRHSVRTLEDDEKLEKLVPGNVYYNKTSTYPFRPDDNNRASFFIDTTRSYPHGTHVGSNQDLFVGRLDGYAGNYNLSKVSQKELDTNRELVYVSEYIMNDDDIGLNIAHCAVSESHIEALVQCNGQECATKKLRKSLTDTRPTSLTGFEHGLVMAAFAKGIATAVSFTSGSSPTEMFISNTSASPFVQQVGHLSAQRAYADLSTLAPEVFSRRLSLVLSTFYQVSTQPTGYFGGLPGNLSLYGPDTLPFNDLNKYLPANLSATEHSFYDWYTQFEIGLQDIQSPFIGATTTAEVAHKKEIFVCDFVWLALLLTSSATILITGGVALVLKRRTLAPEMFGFVTSMTYENPWLSIPKGGTTLDAMERARILKDVEVCVGDVRGTEDVGHIALAAGVPLRKLERGRMYC